MNFFRKIFNNILNFFSKKPPSTEKIISEERKVLDEIFDKEELINKYQESNDEQEKDALITKIAKHSTAKKIIELIENNSSENTVLKKGRKRLYEFHELRSEIQKLEEKIIVLDYNASLINDALNPDTTIIETNILKLSNLLSNNKSNGEVKLSNSYVGIIDNTYKQIENLLREKSTIAKHRNRESDKIKKDELYKNEIKKKLTILETLINQNKLFEAKTLLDIIALSIKVGYKNEILRLNRARVKIKDKELLIFKKQQQELLRIQEEEAKRIKELNDRILEEKRLQEYEKNILEEKNKKQEEEKQLQLESLLINKSNWKDYQNVLKANKIKSLYHFTDKSNIKSIIKNGGLYSWHYSDRNNITIPYPGGGSLSRDLDKRYGLQDYVRISFTKEHPMMYTAKDDGRIKNPIILEIDLKVCYFLNTKYANMNATKTGHNCGDSLDDLQAIKFDIVKLPTHFDILNAENVKYFQAEVLVKTWIPIEFITNINDF
jgi:hypothetical protein